MSTKIWVLSLACMVLISAIDIGLAWRKIDEEKSSAHALRLTVIYITAAIFFGVVMASWTSPMARTGFFATWMTEYTLSFDNLFIFSIIFARLRIEGKKQEFYLYAGIAFSYVLRAISLLTGIALVDSFKFMFAVFGIMLLYTGIQLIREDSDEEWQEGRFLRYLHKRKVPLSGIAIFAIGFSDLMFALDSIPASIGITTDKYVILTSNFFALLGLRQLYFVVDRLIKRLNYLWLGLAGILIFIGAKLVLESLRLYGVSKLGGLQLPIIGVQLSMVVIASILFFAVTLSLVKAKKPKFPF